MAGERQVLQWDVDIDVAAPAEALFDTLAGWYLHPRLLEIASVERHHTLASDGRTEYFWLEVRDLPLKRTYCYGKRLLRRPDAAVTIFLYRFLRADSLADPASIERQIEREWDSVFYHTVRINRTGAVHSRLRAAELLAAPAKGLPLSEIHAFYAELRHIAEADAEGWAEPAFEDDEGGVGSGGRPGPREDGEYNPYIILGVAPTASMSEIKQVYRTLAMRWHPDRAAAYGPAARRYAHNRFVDIAAAYHAIYKMRGA